MCPHVSSWGDPGTGVLGTSPAWCIAPTLPAGTLPPRRAAQATCVALSQCPQPAWGSQRGCPGDPLSPSELAPDPPLHSCCRLLDPSHVSLPHLHHLPSPTQLGGGFSPQIHTHSAGPTTLPGAGLRAFCSPFQNRQFDFGRNLFQHRACLPARLSAEISHP